MSERRAWHRLGRGSGDVHNTLSANSFSTAHVYRATLQVKEEQGEPLCTFCRNVFLFRSISQVSYDRALDPYWWTACWKRKKNREGMRLQRGSAEHNGLAPKSGVSSDGDSVRREWSQLCGSQYGNIRLEHITALFSVLL